MNKSQKFLSVLQFGVLLLIVATLVWSFFNPYAMVALVPLGLISVYYILWYLMVRLVPFLQTKRGYYIVVFAAVFPLITMATASKSVINYSIQFINLITHNR